MSGFRGISAMVETRLYLRQLEIGPMQNFVYLIGDQRVKEVLVVDPAWDVPAILREAQKDGMKIKGALVTHTHFDHVNGAEDLLQATDGTIYVHKKEESALPVSSTNLHAVESGDRIKIGEVEIQLIHTPGHTPGSQCFLVEDKLVSGDTLFIGYCGRCDLPGGDPEEMYRSLTQKLMKLSDRVVLYPGHNYSSKPVSTLGDEKKTNPYFKPDQTLKNFLHSVTGAN